MFSDDLPRQVFPIRDPGPQPIPESVERDAMRDVLRRHLAAGGNCRACRGAPDHTGMCWPGRVAYERLVGRQGDAAGTT